MHSLLHNWERKKKCGRNQDAITNIVSRFYTMAQNDLGDTNILNKYKHFVQVTLPNITCANINLLAQPVIKPYITTLSLVKY